MLEYTFIQFTNGKSLNEVSLSSIVVQKKAGSEFENQYFNNTGLDLEMV